MPPSTDEERTSTVLRIFEAMLSRKPNFGVGVGATREPEPALWAVYSLDAERYRDLLQRIQQDEDLAGFVADKLRFDYFPARNRFVLRGLNTVVHGCFVSSLTCEIQRQLDSFSGSSWAFAQSIHGVGSATIESVDSEFGTHDPDGQFQHSDAQFPGVVIEVVSCSQKRRDIPYLADEYILGSDSNINVMVVLDIENGGEKRMMATWSIWEPEVIKDEVEGDVLIAKQTIENQVFRTTTGTSPNHALKIPLHAFAPSTCYPSNLLPHAITIPAHTLCASLQIGEEMARNRQMGMGIKSRRKVTLRDETSMDNKSCSNQSHD